MMKSTFVLLSCSLLVACGGGGSGMMMMPPDVELIDGFDPPPPGDGQIQFIIPPIRDVPPGADLTYCTYLDYAVPADLDITEYHGFQSDNGAHHVILYGVANREAANTHLCTEEDMVNSRYLAGGGAESPPADLPEGIVLRMRAGAQLMIQTHWINAADTPIDGQGAVTLTVQPPSDEVQVADLFTWLTTDITLEAGATGMAETSCTAQEELSIFLMGGHAHEWGTYIQLGHKPSEASSPSEIMYETEWSAEYQFNPPRNSYPRNEPFMIRPGDVLSAHCDFMNDTDATIRFPAEMCVGWAYYFPATREINCVNGFWPPAGS
jgi:hypothetical protein